MEHVLWKQLPKELFEKFGGRDAAKIRRQEILVSQGKGKIVVPKGVEAAVAAASGAVSEEVAAVAVDGEVKSPVAMEVPAAEARELDKVEAVVEGVKQEEVRTRRKRSLSFSEDTKAVKDEDMVRVQLELEAALEEAEFQSLLLAQNETKTMEEKEHVEEEEKEELPLVESTALYELMSPSVPVWQQNTLKIAFRVPAVTWTMLDSK